MYLVETRERETLSYGAAWYILFDRVAWRRVYGRSRGFVSIDPESIHGQSGRVPVLLQSYTKVSHYFEVDRV